MIKMNRKNNKTQENLQQKIFHAKDETINTITLTVDILMTIIFVLTLILKNDIMFALYWTFTPLLLIVDILSIMHWEIDGMQSEKHEIDKMVKSFRDVTAITIVLSGLGYLTVIFLEIINESISHNLYVVIVLFGLLMITQLFNRLMIHTNIRDASKFAKDFYRKNNKEK